MIYRIQKTQNPPLKSLQNFPLPLFTKPSMRSYMAPTSSPSPFLPPPPPPPATKSTSLPMLYYGLIVVGIAAIVLAMYNLIFIKWSAPRHPPSSPRNVRSNAFVEAARSARSRSFENLDSFKYKKQERSVAQEQGQVLIDYECAVCLSVFEDGEEVRKLPSCKHSFHAPCIDMWLYSHSDCPLCRATVPLVSWCHRELTTTTPEEHSREVLLVSSSIASSPV